MTADSDDQTLAFYDREAVAYADMALSAEDRAHLGRFGGLLPAGGQVLDLGCGAGFHSLALKEAGFQVTPMDGSAGIAQEAEKRCGLPVRVARFDELDDVGAFDGIWAAHTLHHVPHDGLGNVMDRVVRALKPGGQLFAAVKGGDGEHRDSLDRLYAYHTVAGLAGHMEDRGLRVDHVETYPSSGYDGMPCRVIAVFAQRV